jgi:hypothetical protein
MNERRKITGKERQTLIIKTLKEQNRPVTGGDLAKLANVSRQVIVQDISILKAKEEPIIATSRGYLYVQDRQPATDRAVIACKHTPAQTKEELYILVDHGVLIRDVIVEHTVYGDITASLHVSNRKEVDQFIQNIKQTNASFLSELTEGVHLHTIEADSTNKIEEACDALEKAGILISLEE